jgi:cytochrome P450
MLALEDKVRAFCARALDPFVGTDGFDFVTDLGAQVPMRTIGMLLGVPEADQEEARDRADAALRTDPGQPMAVETMTIGQEGFFDAYIDWRLDNPSDDLMTELLFAEFEDETGTVRRLTRDEVLIYVAVLSGAGNETTNRLIGWMGKVLAEHPDQRKELVADRSLVPDTIEELLRFEPPTPHVARHATRDAEFEGGTVPAGSAIVCLSGSANRDDRKYDDPDRFDIHRDIGQHLTFGYGLHFCLGAALARMEGRVVLDEVLRRFPEWDVDLAAAERAPTSTVRGWATMPAVLP